MSKKVNILGTEYTVFEDDFNTPLLKGENRSGYHSFYEKEIHIEDFNTDDAWKGEPDIAKKNARDVVLRHEITHAFLSKSGFMQNSGSVEAWADNEEMVGFFAIQFPKMLKVFEECDCS